MLQLQLRVSQALATKPFVLVLRELWYDVVVDGVLGFCGALVGSIVVRPAAWWAAWHELACGQVRVSEPETLAMVTTMQPHEQAPGG